MKFNCRLFKFRTRGTSRLVRILVFVMIATVFLRIFAWQWMQQASVPLESIKSISVRESAPDFDFKKLLPTPPKSGTKTTPSTSSTTAVSSHDQRQTSTAEVSCQRESNTSTTQVSTQHESITNAPFRCKLAVGIAVAKRNPPTIYRLLEEIFQTENDLRDVAVVVHVAYDVSKDQELLQALHNMGKGIHVDVQKEPHPQADPKNIPSTHGDTMERTIWRTTAGTIIII